MTYRMIILGRRKEELTHEECIEYLEREHVPLVERLPGLHRLTTSIPLDPDEMGYDEMAELWFETSEDLETATRSETWQQIVEDAENFVDLENTVMITVADETVRYDATPEEA